MFTQTDRSAWICGGEIQCREQPAEVGRAYHLILLGPPGVGKGTQAELLCSRLGTCHLSTGDVFRAAKDAEDHQCSPAIRTALEAMRRGDLVSDDTVIDMVRERAACLKCRIGFLLDGFPRTVEQAMALDSLLTDLNLDLDGVLSYELDIDAIVDRLSGRRTCEHCGAVYHVAARKPIVDGVCDHCSGALVQREDDRPESIRVRMAAYEEKTRPLSDYYREAGKLVSVSAVGTAEAIFARALQTLGV